jgi:hypothetical protein
MQLWGSWSAGPLSSYVFSVLQKQNYLILKNSNKILQEFNAFHIKVLKYITSFFKLLIKLSQIVSLWFKKTKNKICWHESGFRYVCGVHLFKPNCFSTIIKKSIKVEECLLLPVHFFHTDHDDLHVFFIAPSVIWRQCFALCLYRRMLWFKKLGSVYLLIDSLGSQERCHSFSFNFLNCWIILRKMVFSSE